LGFLIVLRFCLFGSNIISSLKLMFDVHDVTEVSLKGGLDFVRALELARIDRNFYSVMIFTSLE